MPWNHDVKAVLKAWEGNSFPKILATFYHFPQYRQQMKFQKIPLMRQLIKGRFWTMKRRRR